jgi:uncharacterized protein (DUF488 family)
MEVLTIGYAGLSKDAMCALLLEHNVQAIADVRSSPYSKTFPDYGKEQIPKWLAEKGIRYAYLGDELGPRSKNNQHYKDDQVQFDLLSQTELFKSGLRRLAKGSETMRIAIMCAENDPMTCHRSLLVAEYGQSNDMSFSHILKNGSKETHQEMLKRGMKSLGIVPDMFMSENDCLKLAHERLCKKYAFKKITRAPESGMPK